MIGKRIMTSKSCGRKPAAVIILIQPRQRYRERQRYSVFCPTRNYIAVVQAAHGVEKIPMRLFGPTRLHLRIPDCNAAGSLLIKSGHLAAQLGRLAGFPGDDEGIDTHV